MDRVRIVVRFSRGQPKRSYANWIRVWVMTQWDNTYLELARPRAQPPVLNNYI